MGRGGPGAARLQMQTPTRTARSGGPRRRARRERAERREVQQRARAIEDALAGRPSAGSAARNSPSGPPFPVSETSRAFGRWIWIVVLGVVSVALGLVLYFTPVMSARSVVVVGTGAVSREEVVEAAHVQLGTPLLQIDTDAVADRRGRYPPGGQRAGCSVSTLDVAGHDRRAGAGGGQGLPTACTFFDRDGRTSPPPRRRPPAVYRRRPSRPDRPADRGGS